MATNIRKHGIIFTDNQQPKSIGNDGPKHLPAKTCPVGILKSYCCNDSTICYMQFFSVYITRQSAPKMPCKGHQLRETSFAINFTCSHEPQQQETATTCFARKTAYFVSRWQPKTSLQGCTFSLDNKIYQKINFACGIYSKAKLCRSKSKTVGRVCISNTSVHELMMIYMNTN